LPPPPFAAHRFEQVAHLIADNFKSGPLIYRHEPGVHWVESPEWAGKAESAQKSGE
jgi:hypothetical protein